MREKAFTLVELMVGISIALIVFSVAGTSYVLFQRLWRGGISQVGFQSTGRVALEKISNEIRLSTSATVLNNGDRIRFVTDPNRTYNNVGDDITSEYYIQGTDLMYDPNLSSAGDERVFLSNVSRESAIAFFQIAGNLVVITYKVFDNDLFYGTHWASMTTSVKMRNTY